MNALKTVVVAVVASLVLYCGTAVVSHRDATPDALAYDAGMDAGMVCDCPPIPPPDPVCESCSTKLEYSGVFVADYEVIHVGEIENFNPDSGRGLPTVQRWYYNATDGRWVQGVFHVFITETGGVQVQSAGVEFVNREFRVILTWVGMNPGL